MIYKDSPLPNNKIKQQNLVWPALLYHANQSFSSFHRWTVQLSFSLGRFWLLWLLIRTHGICGFFSCDQNVQRRRMRIILFTPNVNTLILFCVTLLTVDPHTIWKAAEYRYGWSNSKNLEDHPTRVNQLRQGPSYCY